MKPLLPVGITGGRGLRLAGKELLLLLALALIALASMRAHAAEPMTPAEVMARGEERFRTLQDYQCAVQMESRVGTKVETGACDFWFKQPRMLRAKITGGKRKGSVVAVDDSGTIRGHQSGLFKGVVRKLQPSDSRLQTIRGASLLNLDWGSFFLKYHYSAARPSSRVTFGPRDAATGSPYQVQVSYPDQGKRVRETYSVDPQRWVLVEGEVQEDGVRVEHLVFEDIKLDTGVESPWFKL